MSSWPGRPRAWKGKETGKRGHMSTVVSFTPDFLDELLVEAQRESQLTCLIILGGHVATPKQATWQELLRLTDLGDLNARCAIGPRAEYLSLFLMDDKLSNSNLEKKQRRSID